MGYCTICEKHTTDDVNYCPHCGGNLISSNSKNNMSHTPHHRSNWWYLAPIFLGIIGGLIAYFVLKNDDAKLAKKCLIVGVIMFVFGFIIAVSSGL